MAIDEPNYRVIQTNDLFEVRVYEPYVVAQTTVGGNFDDNGGMAFRKLFKYISGNNQLNTTIPMTAPVIQESREQKGEKIPMTAPVIQESDAANPNSSVYSFVMPLNSTLDTLPIPLDESISLKEIPAKKVAVRAFSGFWSERNYKEN
ncbi:MAG: heme-binding protein, partial [Campylobacteraceae bacterium]|nr:heme-binding protein [Campylobacteraceae bacterium]